MSAWHSTCRYWHVADAPFQPARWTLRGAQRLRPCVLGLSVSLPRLGVCTALAGLQRGTWLTRTARMHCAEHILKAVPLRSLAENGARALARTSARRCRLLAIAWVLRPAQAACHLQVRGSFARGCFPEGVCARQLSQSQHCKRRLIESVHSAPALQEAGGVCSPPQQRDGVGRRPAAGSAGCGCCTCVPTGAEAVRNPPRLQVRV